MRSGRSTWSLRQVTLRQYVLIHRCLPVSVAVAAFVFSDAFCCLQRLYKLEVYDITRVHLRYANSIIG